MLTKKHDSENGEKSIEVTMTGLTRKTKISTS